MTDLTKAKQVAQRLRERASNFQDLTGMKFGRLTVVELHSIAGSKSKWICQCECGGKSTPTGSALKSGNSKSCGCLKLEQTSNINKTHGMTKTTTYFIWQNMRNRCSKPTNKYYIHYGGRGIGYTPRWESFENFLADMGERPDGLELDRIDNNLGYSKENCRWVSRKEQMRNTRKSLKYQGVPLSEIAEKTGIKYDTLFYSLKKYGDPFRTSTIQVQS